MYVCIRDGNIKYITLEIVPSRFIFDAMIHTLETAESVHPLVNIDIKYLCTL